MAIYHIVLLEFKPTTHHSKVEEICSRLSGLAQNCVHPTSKKPYMKSSVGGRDNSPEGHQVVGGFTHGFVMEFESAEDRDYYVYKDPAHLDFVKFVGPHVQNIRVIDFEPGKM